MQALQVALVELDEGPRLLTDIVDVPVPGVLTVGMWLQLRIECQEV